MSGPRIQKFHGETFGDTSVVFIGVVCIDLGETINDHLSMATSFCLITVLEQFAKEDRVVATSIKVLDSGQPRSHRLMWDHEIPVQPCAVLSFPITYAAIHDHEVSLIVTSRHFGK